MMNFASEAARKEAISAISKRYENVRDRVLNALLDLRNSGKFDAKMIEEIYWNTIPDNLSNFRLAKKGMDFVSANFVDEVAEMNELFEARKEAREAIITPVAKKSEFEIKVAEMEERIAKKYSEEKSADLSEEFYLPVNASMFWVRSCKGNYFLRAKYYLMGSVRSLREIMIVSEYFNALKTGCGVDVAEKMVIDANLMSVVEFVENLSFNSKKA